jgi:hypothetical protein
VSSDIRDVVGDSNFTDSAPTGIVVVGKQDVLIGIQIANAEIAVVIAIRLAEHMRLPAERKDVNRVSKVLRPLDGPRDTAGTQLNVECGMPRLHVHVLVSENLADADTHEPAVDDGVIFARMYVSQVDPPLVPQLVPFRLAK